MEEQNNNGQLQIELREEVAQGTYANLAIITHSSSEFILDFVRVMRVYRRLVCNLVLLWLRSTQNVCCGH